MLPADRGSVQGHRVGCVVDLRLQVEVLEDPVEQGERAVDLDLDVEQLAEREEQAALERGERHDVARPWAGRGLPMMASVPASQYTNAGMMREDRAHDHEEPATDHALADLEAGQRGLRAAELLDRAWPAARTSWTAGCPMTLSVSSVMAVTSARLFWVSVLMPRRTLPTR